MVMASKDHNIIIMLTQFTMDSSKTLDNNRPSTKMSRLKSSMFTAAALSIVLLSNHTPINILRLQESLTGAIHISTEYSETKIQLFPLELPEMSQNSVKQSQAFLEHSDMCKIIYCHKNIHKPNIILCKIKHSTHVLKPKNIIHLKRYHNTM